VFEHTGGFKFDRFAEDIEFSIRMKQAGLAVVLIPEAFVFHKRRTTFGQFFNQVHNFGKGRAVIGKAYPREVKLTHWFPALFTIGLLFIPLLAILYLPLAIIGLGSYTLYFTAIFLDSWTKNDFAVAVLSVPAALLQMSGYGLGFLKERLKPYRGRSTH
jgi:GT2 family glycosyltransferase